jgi:hypothetical protein
MESMECDVVLDTTSPSGLELSAASSLFFDVLLGAITFVIERNPVVEEKCIILG